MDDPAAHRPARLNDRTGVRRRELREHLLAQSFDVLETEAPIAGARQTNGTQEPALLPIAQLPRDLRTIAPPTVARLLRPRHGAGAGGALRGARPGPGGAGSLGSGNWLAVPSPRCGGGTVTTPRTADSRPAYRISKPNPRTARPRPTPRPRPLLYNFSPSCSSRAVARRPYGHPIPASPPSTSPISAPRSRYRRPASGPKLTAWAHHQVYLSVEEGGSGAERRTPLPHKPRRRARSEPEAGRRPVALQGSTGRDQQPEINSRRHRRPPGRRRRSTSALTSDYAHEQPFGTAPTLLQSRGSGTAGRRGLTHRPRPSQPSSGPSSVPSD